MELIIFIGLQGSGKSTCYQICFGENYVYVSKDLLRNNRRPARRQLQLIEEALQANHSVVVDNTNPALEDRAALIQLGQRYGATVIGYYFVPEVKKSLVRNQQRIGKERVPNIAIFTTAKRLVRPTYAEGFAQLFSVQACDDFTFEISEWQEQDTKGPGG